jgi:hypothetical protein
VNLTIARTIPATRKLVTWQHVVLAIGLSALITAAVVIGWQAAGSSSGPPEAAAVPSSVGQATALPATFYIVDSQAQAEALNSVANDGLGGPVEIFVASEPGAEEQLAVLFFEDAHGMLQNTRIVDTRSW